VRSDGSIIDSSVIISCEFTEDVNSSTNLSLGDISSSELNVEIRSTEAIRQGEILTYCIIEDGVEKQIGIFIAEKPTVASRTSIRFSAYDNISRTEKVVSEWLRENQSLFPMTAMNLVLYVCQYCGAEYTRHEFPNQDIMINAFYADGITCRQVLSWVGEMAGRFVRANAEGKIEFAQYVKVPETIVTYQTGQANPVDMVVTDNNGDVGVTNVNMTVTDDGNGNVVATISGVNVLDVDGHVSLSMGVSIPYRQGGLSYETYQTDKIERVQIKHSDDDVGVIYPVEATGNTYSISRNMVLGACSLEDVTVVAETLYNQLKSVSYVPFTVNIPRTTAVRAGDIITVQDVNGNSFVSLVMKMSLSPTGVVISSTGDKSYGSSTAVASEKFSNLTGKILEISKSIDGLTVANKDLEGKFGELVLSNEEFKTTLSETYVTEDEFGKYQQTFATRFEQTAKDFTFSFEDTIADNTAATKDLQDKYLERTSYIRFEDGNIILGKSDSEIMLIQKNDRISFVRNVANKPEVAWFADDVLHVTEGEFTVQLDIGKFGFKPGARGNLSFKKVVK
jgi:hypothetical protein